MSSSSSPTTSADTIAALGNPHIITPNLDELARRGLVFSNAYCLGANVAAVCTPSRNMLLSGQSYFHYGKQADPQRPNFPTSLKQAGYVTYHHGKRGNTALAIQALFDHNHYVNEGQTRKSGEPARSSSTTPSTSSRMKRTASPSSCTWRSRRRTIRGWRPSAT